MLRLFDSHCHLDDERFDGDRDKVITGLADAGVTACTCVGSDLASSERVLALAEKYPFIYAAVGVHPHEAGDAPEDYLERLAVMLTHRKAVALGEIGLDYYYDHSPRERQKQVFIQQILLAHETRMPVILHIRDAHGDALDILKRHSGLLHGGIVHCYSGSAQSAAEYRALGLEISFTGTVTFKNARKLREAAAAVPPEHLLIETDSPYLSPEPFRGKRNSPAYVYRVCETLAELHGMTPDEMADITYQNALRVYRITET